MPQQLNDQSFLLRCRQVRSATDDKPAVWRFALRTVSAEPTEHTFPHLDALVEWISAEITITPNQP